MERPHIRTDRSTLQLLGLEQAELLHQYEVENREHLTPWEPLRELDFYTLESARERIRVALRTFRAGTGVRFGVLPQDGSEVWGITNLSNIVRGSFQACHLGYAVCKSREGTGIMREAVAATLEFAFDTLGLHRVMANHLPTNLRSARLLASLGFEREGFARQYLQIAGRWEDHVLNSKINPKWSPSS